MQLRSEVQLASMMKAMTDVVIPAIDAKNDLAIQQAHLIVGMLNLMAHQLPMQFRFDRDELQRLVKSAEGLSLLSSKDSAVSAAVEQLAASCDAAVNVLKHCVMDPAELVASVKTMREATSMLMVAASRSDDKAAFAAVEQAVLALSKEQLLRDRSLLLVQGWEPDPSAIPPIEKLLGSAPVSA